MAYLTRPQKLLLVTMATHWNNSLYFDDSSDPPSTDSMLTIQYGITRMNVGKTMSK